MSTPARWTLAQELFHAALEHPADGWQAFLAGRTSDEALRREVLRMLAADADGSLVLDRGLQPATAALLGPAANEALPAQSFGPYEVTGFLGEGGMGVVYKAVRKDLGREVAIKVLRDAWLSPARRDRFHQETRLLALLRHPGIAALYDAGTLPDATPYFVMEYVEGEPLSTFAADKDLDTRLSLIRQVCEAVQYAHGQAVIHRDLKPSNVLVTARGQVKLLDFGIARPLGPSTENPTHTATRMLTPAYAAPEQLRGERAGTETDVYALGVMLYELLTGRLPFELAGLGPGEVDRRLLDSEPLRPSKAAPRGAVGGRRLSRATWADLDVLVTKAMQKERERRYRTVDALARDLDHFREGAPLDARPDELSYRLRKAASRHRRVLLPVAAAGLALVGVVATYTVRLRAARNAAQAEARRARRLQEFTLDLFEGGEHDPRAAETLKAITLVDRGAQKAKAFSEEPAVQAELFATLGGIYRSLGRFTLADDLLGKALAERRALFGESHPEVGASLVDLGTLRARQGKLDEAEHAIRAGLAIAQSPAGSSENLVKAKVALGVLEETRGHYDACLAALGEAARLQERIAPMSPTFTLALSEMANCHFYKSEYAETQALSERSLAINRKLHGEQHPSVSNDLFNIGVVAFEQGRYADAEKLYRQGVAITEGWYGPDHVQTADDLIMLGRVLATQKKLDEAKPIILRALAIHRAAFGDVHTSIASDNNELGIVASLGGHPEEARGYFLENLGLYEKIYGDKPHYLEAVALSNVADAELRLDRLNEAEAHAREALVIAHATLPATHNRTAILRVLLGRILLAEKRYAEAIEESLHGHDVLEAVSKTQVSWLEKARQDLVKAYEALQQPEKAALFRAKLAASVTKSGSNGSH